jgi:ABC-type dipeptide transport system, periplasmic component
MWKKLIAIILIILITVSGFYGCGSENSFLGGSTKEKKDMVHSDEIYIPIEKIRTLNPVITKDEDAYYIDHLIYEGLFGFDQNLTLIPVLADSYSYGDAGYSVTIQLKSGIKWQDGESFTAEDVKFSIEAYQSASYANLSLYSSNIKNIKSVRLDKADPYRITIYFTANNDVSMEKLTFPIIPEHKFKNIDQVKRDSEGFIPMGTGSYKVVDYNELTHLTLKGNEDYHGTVPGNTMNFQIMPDKLDAIKLIEVNNISLTFSKEIDRNTIFSNKDVKVIPFNSNEVELVGFNFRNPVMKNKNVRKAIACAIDIQDILEGSYYNNGILNDNIYYPNYLGVAKKKSKYSFNIEKSKAYLTKAGYIDRNGDGLVENANNEIITVNILVNSEDQSRTAAAQIIKSSLDKLPIQSSIKSVDWNTYQSDLSSGAFDIFVGGFQIDEHYDLRFLLHTNFANPIGYSNPALDVLLDKMQSGVTADERKNTYVKIRDILDDDLPYFCLLYKTYGAIVSPALKGEVKPNFINLYNGCENWSCEYEKQAVDTEDKQENTN